MKAEIQHEGVFSDRITYHRQSVLAMELKYFKIEAS